MTIIKRKFKKDDLVECIEGESKGAGWKLNHKFIVTNITSGSDNYGNSDYVYWKAIDNNGVHQDSLKLASEYELKTNKTE